MSQKLSRELGAYRNPSPAARAVRQLEEAGKAVRPGQRVRFLYTRGRPGVHAWDVPPSPCGYCAGTLPEQFDPRSVDVRRYQTLLKRAVETVLAPIGQSVNGGKEDECQYLFPVKIAEPLGEGGTQRLDLMSISKVINFVNGGG